jgi:hypothetical protein
LEELDESIRDNIRPFFKPDKRASADLLNEVQIAFVKYRVSTMHENKETISSPLIEQFIAEGVEHRIWPEDFVVWEATNDFSSYLLNRIRNEKKALSKKKQ